MCKRAASIAASWAVAFLCAASVYAPAAAMEAEDCLGCHGDRSIIEQGGAHLYIDAAKYAHTPHADEGCPSCHASVTDAHPDDGVRPSRASCGDCHDEVATLYAKSAHGANASCTDCHDPHAVRSPTAVSGQDVNRQCSSCHDREAALSSHGKWLPQAEVHIDRIPCISCHVRTKSHVITLYIEKSGVPTLEDNYHLASRPELASASGASPVERVIDQDGDRFVSLGELRAFHRGGRRGAFRLRGTLMPSEIVHDFATLDNRWDCSFCHGAGTGALQTAFVAIPGEDGRFERLPVEKGAILDLLHGTPDFYMMGATRNDGLTKLGLGIVSCGLLVPLGHGVLRLLTYRNRKEN